MRAYDALHCGRHVERYERQRGSLAGIAAQGKPDEVATRLQQTGSGHAQRTALDLSEALEDFTIE
jgi:hypothetical protein